MLTVPSVTVCVRPQPVNGLNKQMVFQMLLLFQMPDQHFAFGHKLGAIPYKSDTSQFRIDGVAQLSRYLLFE